MIQLLFFGMKWDKAETAVHLYFRETLSSPDEGTSHRA